MVQTRKTGSTISCLWPALPDHARMPVMLPRRSDSEMCRDGSNAASPQPQTTVDEPGGVHGVPDLGYSPGLRTLAWKIVGFTVLEGDGRWRILRRKRPQLGGQDKRTGAIRRPSLCLHIFFYGAIACRHGAIKRLRHSLLAIFMAPACNTALPHLPHDLSTLRDQMRS
jgi:hypothetical protein